MHKRSRGGRLIIAVKFEMDNLQVQETASRYVEILEKEEDPKTLTDHQENENVDEK